MQPLEEITMKSRLRRNRRRPRWSRNDRPGRRDKHGRAQPTGGPVEAINESSDTKAVTIDIVKGVKT